MLYLFFLNNIPRPAEIILSEYRAVYVVRSVVPAVEKVEKAFDGRSFLTMKPLHEDDRNIYLVEELSSS